MLDKIIMQMDQKVGKNVIVMITNIYVYGCREHKDETVGIER